MQIYVLFGLPGAGKTFIGGVFREEFGFYFHDADLDLPREMKLAIQAKDSITENMTDIFFKEIVKSIKKLKTKHNKIIVAQAFFKEKYRKYFLNEFPEAKFILIDTSTHIREDRLVKRTDYPLDLEYARKMYPYFEKPSMNYEKIHNDLDKAADVKRQIKAILSK